MLLFLDDDPSRLRFFADLVPDAQRVNERIELLYDRDHQIGHSYFLEAQSLSDLRKIFCDAVIPMLQEYFYGDWGKICAVLGCPFDPATGKTYPSNKFPLITPTKLESSQLTGVDLDDYEDKVRCDVSRTFIDATDEGLVAYFQGVLKTADPYETE